MRSLRRTNAIDFTELSDDDSYYSAGETSDDMINDNLSNSKAKDKNSSETDSFSSFISIQQHLSTIDSKVSDRSQISSISSFDDEDFYLEKLNKPFVPPSSASSQVKQETIGCAIINVAHAAHYKDIVSEYNNTNKRFIAWNAIPYTTKTLPQFNTSKNEKDSSKLPDPVATASSDSTVNVSDFPLVVHSFYKDAYNSYRTQIRFVHFASPSADKLDTIRNARKEIPNARILFHYVGFGYPDPVDGCIYTCEGKSSSMVKYRIDKLMDYIKPPSIFIFDCNKAGSLFSSLLKTAKQHLNESTIHNNPNTAPKTPNNDAQATNQVSWKDWYCLCATMNEDLLPQNSKLPRDFLTSCLLSPIQTSILCHIIQYYSTTEEFGTEPFEYVKKNFNKFNNGKINELVDILHSIADSIASELVKPSTFSHIFRGDSFVCSLFYHFMLSQFLLRPYSIHPVSFPVIPDAVGNHPLWLEWTSIIDTLITSTLSPLPSFTTNLFWRVSTIFNSITNQNYSKSSVALTQDTNSMTQVILTLMCHAIFLNATGGKNKNGEMTKDSNRNLSLMQNSSSNTSSSAYSSFEQSTYNLISSNKLKSKSKTSNSSSTSLKCDDDSLSSYDSVTDEQISYNAIKRLAEFASKSVQNRESLKKSVIFGHLFKKLLKYFNDSSTIDLNIVSNSTYPRVIKKDEFHSLCFLIVSLLQTDMSLFFEVKTDSDFSKLPSLLFDKNFSQVTLSYIAAILASAVYYVSSVKILCSSRDFLLKLKESIPTFSPDLLAWSLILLKKTFDNSSIDEENFSRDSIHMQVAACIFHNDCQCRAATISSLSCFMQQKGKKNSNNNSSNNSSASSINIKFNSLSKNSSSSPSNITHNLENFGNLSPPQFNCGTLDFEDENQINKTLFFIPFPSFADASYLVRFQYLLFIIRFLTSSRNLYELILGNSTQQANKNDSLAITDLHMKIHEMMDIDTLSFKNIIAEWMCLVKSTANAQALAAAKASEINSSNSLPNHPLLNSSSNSNLNNTFGSSNDSLLSDGNGSLNFDFGITNFENYAKIVDSVCKRDDVKIRMYALSLFMLDYFSHDPHPAIRSTAIKARHYYGIDINKNANTNINTNYNDNVKSTEPTKSPKGDQQSQQQQNATAKTKGNFFLHFNKNMFQAKQQQQQQDASTTSNNNNNALNVNQSSPSNQIDQTFGTTSASSSFQSSVPNQMMDIYSASSSINSACFNSNSDPPNSNSSSSSAKSPTTNATTIGPSSSYVQDNTGQLHNPNLGPKEEDASEYSCDSSLSTTFFESDSQALFNISLKRLTKNGQWFLPQSDDIEKSRFTSKIRRKSMRSSNLGNVEVPGISIQLRAQSKYLCGLSANSSPTFIAHDNESMNLAVATKDRNVYLFDENLSIINKIKTSESDISDLKFITNIYTNTNNNANNRTKFDSTKYDNQKAQKAPNQLSDIKSSASTGSSSSSSASSSNKYLCAFATCDGCMKLWDSRNSEPCFLWRCSSTFNDEKTPLLFTSNDFEQEGSTNYQSHIITGRGSDEICVWDLTTQRLVCEYISNSLVKEYNKQVSAMSIHPSDPNVIVVGYSNGLITSLDTRAPASTLNSSITSYSSTVSNVSLSFSLPGEKIISLTKNTNGGDILYAATTKGNAVVWNTTSGMITTSYLSRKYGISSFNVHQMLPLIAYSNKTQPPSIVSTQGKVFMEMNSPLVPANSLVTFHPIFPFVTFAAPTGELTSYNIVVSHC
ncbi:hypothetical protein M9Y10_021968 [Tritrichomonas musculus]|uniref:Raptor N-terminal CASPase-like domain-containing protein n=1 Tax=Tritrichomonas musculus TaxID=1915356 RepID=A0ABR2KR76_9EUKA